MNTAPTYPTGSREEGGFALGDWVRHRVTGRTYRWNRHFKGQEHLFLPTTDPSAPSEPPQQPEAPPALENLVIPIAENEIKDLI